MCRLVKRSLSWEQIFPKRRFQSKQGTYLYPIKKEKKKKEGTYCEDEDAP